MAVLKIKDEQGNVIAIPSIKGERGEDGYTPQRGTDYWTDDDKTEIVNAVIAALPKYNGEVEDV